MRPITIASVPWERLVRIGSGWYSTVFGYGPYAVKVGTVGPAGIELQQRAARIGYSVPVLGYQADVPEAALPASLRAKLCPIEPRADGKLDILVMGRALPVLRTPPFSNDHGAEEGRLYVVANKLARRISRLAGVTWADPNPWNLGIYENHLVALDWQETD
jgi:hypothetical protein